MQFEVGLASSLPSAVDGFRNAYRPDTPPSFGSMP